MKEKPIFSFLLFLSWDVCLSWPSEFRVPSSWTSGLQALHHWLPWFTGLCKLNYITNFSAFPACRQQIPGFLSLHWPLWANFYNKSPPYLSIYLPMCNLLALFLWRTLTSPCIMTSYRLFQEWNLNLTTNKTIHHINRLKVKNISSSQWRKVIQWNSTLIHKYEKREKLKKILPLSFVYLHANKF